jgi:hypothetical protein
MAVLLAWIPDTFSIDAEVQDEISVGEISANNLIVYANSGSDNMTIGDLYTDEGYFTNVGYTSLEDAPDAPQYGAGLPGGEYLEVWWSFDGYVAAYYIELRHVSEWFLGYKHIDYMDFYYADGGKASVDIVRIPGIGGSTINGGLTKDAVVSAWSADSNSSAFTASCDHASVSFVLKPGENETSISTAWDNGNLWYALSYEWDPNATGFNLMNVLTNLLLFQGVGIGVPGILGDFIDGVISAFFYIAIAVCAYSIITAVIPFIPGWKG